MLMELVMPEVMIQQCQQWLKLLEELDEQVQKVEKWLQEKAVIDKQVELLRTHPGIGLLSALALVHMLEPVTRFSNQRQVVAYVGLEPVEHSSGEETAVPTLVNRFVSSIRHPIESLYG